MNEENVTNIVNYLQQYPDESTEVLVQNLIQSGYTLPDIQAALKQLGISPIVIPGYTEEIPPQSLETPHFKGPLIIGGGAIILLLIITGILLLATRKKPEPEEQNRPGIQQQAVFSPPTTTPIPTIVLSRSPTQSARFLKEVIPTVVNNAPKTSNPNFNGDDSYEIKVDGNVIVDIYDQHGRQTGLMNNGTVKSDIPLVQYDVQDSGVGLAGIIFQTDIVGILGNTSEYIDIKLRFRENGRAIVKIVIRDATIDIEKPGNTNILADRKQMVVYQGVEGKNGQEGVIRMFPQINPNSWQLEMKDQTGQVIQTTAPTYILNTERSQDVQPPVTTMTKRMENGKLMIELNATDDNSGIHVIEYSLNGGYTVQNYTNPFPANGAPSIDFTSIDKAGNIESIVREKL